MKAKINDITITILGSGTCVPSLKRSSCSVLVNIGGTKLLFDLGPGTMKRLLEANATIFEISHVFLSHFHPDHSGELVPFLFSTKYPDINQRRYPLYLAGGKGFFQFYNRLKTVYGCWMELKPGILKIIEMDNKNRDEYLFEGFSVESIPVCHNEESIAYRVTGQSGKSVVYSGDTDFSANLITLSKNADILICESALPDDLKALGHLTPSQAGEIARQANVKQLILTHFYPECERADIEKQCRKSYSGNLILAEDLMEIKLL